LMSKPIYPKLNPATYIELADQLSARNESSAKRTAADRAYFAAFLSSRDRLLEKGYLEPYGNLEDHGYISRVLKSEHALGAFGNEENRLRRARNRITYDTGDLYLKPPVRKLNWMLETAKEIIKRVEELPVNPKKT
jgi:hypothetical protein